MDEVGRRIAEVQRFIEARPSGDVGVEALMAELRRLWVVCQLLHDPSITPTLDAGAASSEARRIERVLLTVLGGGDVETWDQLLSTLRFQAGEALSPLWFLRHALREMTRLHSSMKRYEESV